MKRYTHKERDELKAQVKKLLFNEHLNAAEISRKTGVTQKTLGLWIKEIQANHIKEVEQKTAQEQKSIKALLTHLKKAKWDFIKQVDTAIDNYLKLNS